MATHILYTGQVNCSKRTVNV